MISPEPLRFPNPNDEKYIENYTLDFKLELFKEDYESCLVELGLIIERTFDPVLRGKLESLMAGVPGWLV